ncbi:MAG: hypothetical protein ABIA78_01175 [archaeon]
MIPINQEKILKKIEEFKSENHPEFDKYLMAPIFIYGENEIGELDRYSKRPFFNLSEVLSNSSELYLAHNGEIMIGLPFEKVTGLFQILPTDYREEYGFQRAYSNKMSKYSLLENLNFKDSPYLTSLFREKLFGLKSKTFLCSIVEAGYGLRIDSRGQINEFLQMILDKEIPLFIDRFDTNSKKPYEERGYVINGFEV